MKRYILILLTLITITAYSQVPYFGTSTGNKKIYTYSQIKVIPNESSQFYTSVNYGVMDKMDVVMNYNSGTQTNAWGLKYSFLNREAISIALQPMTEFLMGDSYKWIDVNTGLFINGYLTDRLSYISNTWYTQTESNADFEQWSYLGYDVWKLTFIAGAITNLSNNCKSDLAIGVWIPWVKNGCIYLWGGNLTNNLGSPKITLGFDYKF